MSVLVNSYCLMHDGLFCIFSSSRHSCRLRLSVCLSPSIVFVCAVYWGHFLCIVSLRWYAFCLLVVLVKLSVRAKWLARKNTLRKPNRGEGIVSSPGRRVFMIFLVYCIVLLFYDVFVLSSGPTPMEWYSLFVLKVPLNTTHTHCFNGHFSRWTWVSRLPP